MVLKPADAEVLKQRMSGTRERHSLVHYNKFIYPSAYGYCTRRLALMKGALPFAQSPYLVKMRAVIQGYMNPSQKQLRPGYF